MGVGSGGGASKFPEFTYTGDYMLIDDGKEEKVQNWRVKFLTSGTLIFTKEPGSADVFLVGGGSGGNGSRGGGGGYTFTSTSVLLVKETPYEIIIGAGGANSTNGGDTSAFGLTAKGGNEANGGSGGGGNTGGADPGYGGTGGSDGSNGGNATGYNAMNSWGYGGGIGQGTTTRAFGETTGDLYAGGGGGSSTSESKHGAGGEGGGGGKGAPDGQVNTGGGGMGGNTSVGGSGIVIIRNHREVTA